MAKTNVTTSPTKSNTPDNNLKPLDILAGQWVISAPNPMEPTQRVHGTVSFEWLSGGRYLIERVIIDHADFPDSIAIIGYDEITRNFTQHYFDSRGVERIYGMSLIDNVWKLWRDAPGFSQRFIGTISDDGNAITSRWEKSVDGSNWEHDFDLTYTRSE
jgi:hypothetical protein